MIINQNFNIYTQQNRQKQSSAKTHPAESSIENNTKNHSQHYYLPIFTGLNRTLSKTAYQYTKSIEKELENFPKSKGIVGNLPSEWIQKIPKDKRAEKIKEFYADLKYAVLYSRNNIDDAEEMSKTFNLALNKAGILKENQKIEVKYIDKGKYGEAFHLKGLSDDNYIIKIFKAPFLTNNYHGRFIEPNRAAFWQKHAGKNTQMVPFYFADVDAGYMVNKFLSDKTPKCEKYISPEVYGLVSHDINKKDGHNLIRGFQIDYGGISVESISLTKDKQSQQQIKILLSMPTDEQLAKLSNVNKKLKILFADNFIDNFKERDRLKLFKQLNHNADEDIKQMLLHNLYKVEKEDRLEALLDIASNASKKILSQIPFASRNLPEDKAKVIFDIMIKNPDADIKNAVVDNLHILSEKDSLNFFKHLAKDSTPELRTALAKNIFNVIGPQRLERLKILVSKSSQGENALALIAKNITNKLPDEDQLKGVKILMEKAGLSEKRIVLSQINFFADSDIPKVLNILSHKADKSFLREIEMVKEIYN